MTSQEFNQKWKNYLETGFYGMAIEDLEVIKYLDSEFSKEVLVNPNFSYSQIKIKFGSSRVYAESDKTHIWEKEINRLIKKRLLKL